MLDIFKYTLGANGWLKAWAMYLIAFPFYFFPAGSAQPSDILIIALIGIFILTNGMNFSQDGRKILGRFLRFVGYITLVNFILYVVMLGSANVGLQWYFYTAFYAFNLCVMGFALALHKIYGRQFLFTTAYACIFAGILQIVLSFVLQTSGEGVRGAMFFTNPNQLGYYSLSALAIVLVLETSIKIPRIMVYLSFFVFSYLALVSVSKAALGAMIILFGVYLIANKIFSARNILAIIVVGGLGFIGITQSEFGKRFQRNLEARNINEESRGEEITEWEYRGYDRISHHPSYLVLGAGEGAYNRFDTFITNHEMHSSVGTILFCYGIPGTVFFIMFIFAILRRLPWYYLVYSFPLFAYGITHMGLRFTIFWVALIMFPVIRAEIARTKYIQKRRRLEALKNYNRTDLSKVSTQGAA